MKIGIVSTHSWPIPTPVFTGDIVILDLAIALHELGHDVMMFAPAGTKAPGKLCEMPASLGASDPTARECEVATWNAYQNELRACDVVHDFSVEKNIAERTMAAGRPAISTLLGGNYNRPASGRNVCVWSHAMRERALHGYTDYWQTPTPELAGPPTRPLTDAHVVYGGIDTDFYCPTDYTKSGYFLWLNRWHPAKGFAQAIQLAKDTGIALVMAGQHPDDMRWDSEKEHAREAIRSAEGCKNIRFEWLPAGQAEHHLAKRELYRRATSLLYPVQFQEPFGLSMVEAMACGTPVIGNDYGSVLEIIANTGFGWIAEEDGDWAQRVARPNVLAEPRDCRTEAVERFSRRAMAERYLKEYAAVIRGEGWGGCP